MILADNNILSTFGRVDALELLFALFRTAELGVTPAVRSEVLEAIAQGCLWLEEVVKLFDKGRLQLIAPTTDEILTMPTSPDSLGEGERESIAVCQARGWAFLTNDKRARNFCRQKD